jgi:peptidyl-prolyl cis-trans isomerase B (cyclophilin B)
MRRRLITSTALLALALAAGCSSEDAGGTASDPSSESTSSSSSGGTGVECTYDSAGSPAKEVEPPPTEAASSGEVAVTLTTSIGDLSATLGADATPCTVGSFTSLAEQGYFDATQCHRLTTQGIYVLQCGDPTGTGTGGPGYQFDDELSGEETYEAGTLAMANAGPNTNGSQFFIVYEDTELPPSYTVFGTVDPESTKLVQEAAAAGTSTGGPDGPPKTPIEIETVTVG